MKNVVFAVLVAGILTACAPSQPQTITLPTMHEIVQPLPSGNWVVRYNLPSKNYFFKSKFFVYYAALYAESIKCPKFAKAQNIGDHLTSETFGCSKFDKDGYNTADVLATGFP